MKEKYKHKFRCVVCGGWINNYFVGLVCEDCGIQYRAKPKDFVYNKNPGGIV